MRQVFLVEYFWWSSSAGQILPCSDTYMKTENSIDIVWTQGFHIANVFWLIAEPLVSNSLFR